MKEFKLPIIVVVGRSDSLSKDFIKSRCGAFEEFIENIYHDFFYFLM